jgi:hypothetical protein
VVGVVAPAHAVERMRRSDGCTRRAVGEVRILAELGRGVEVHRGIDGGAAHAVSARRVAAELPRLHAVVIGRPLYLVLPLLFSRGNAVREVVARALAALPLS